MSLPEYHARQMANQATNRDSGAQADAVRYRNTARDAVRHIEKAIALLGEGADDEVRAELNRAIDMLRAIR
jgi:hypothetical protein